MPAAETAALATSPNVAATIAASATEAPAAPATPAPAATATDAKTTAAPATEAKVVGKIEPKPTDGQRVAQIERQQQKRERSLLDKERELAAKETELKEAQEYKRIRELVATDPAKAAELMGLDYDKLTQAKLAGADAAVTKEDLAALRNEIKTEKERDQEAAKKAESERLLAMRAAALDDFKGKIRAEIDADPDAYELVKNHFDLTRYESPETLVLDVVQAHYAEAVKTDPKAKPLTHKQGIELVEKWLHDKLSSASQAKKLKPAATPAAKETPAAAAEAKAEPAATPTTTAPKTITNDMTATAASLAKPSDPTKQAIDLERQGLELYQRFAAENAAKRKQATT